MEDEVSIRMQTCAKKQEIHDYHEGAVLQNPPYLGASLRHKITKKYK